MTTEKDAENHGARACNTATDLGKVTVDEGTTHYATKKGNLMLADGFSHSSPGTVGEHTTHCPRCNANWHDRQGYGINCAAQECPHTDGIWSWACLKCGTCFPSHAQKQYNTRRQR